MFWLKQRAKSKENVWMFRGTKYYLSKSRDYLYYMQIYVFEEILWHGLVNIFHNINGKAIVLDLHEYKCSYFGSTFIYLYPYQSNILTNMELNSSSNMKNVLSLT